MARSKSISSNPPAAAAAAKAKATKAKPKPKTFAQALDRIPLSVYRTHAYVGGSKRVRAEAKIMYKYILAWITREFARRLMENVAANKRMTIFPMDVQLEASLFPVQRSVAGIACAGLHRKRTKKSAEGEAEAEAEGEAAPVAAVEEEAEEESEEDEKPQEKTQPKNANAFRALPVPTTTATATTTQSNRLFAGIKRLVA